MMANSGTLPSRAIESSRAWVADDASAAPHAEGVAGAGDEEDHADVGVMHEVDEGVGSVVAGAFGNGEGRIVEDLTNPGGSPLGEASIASGAIGGGDDDERRSGK